MNFFVRIGPKPAVYTAYIKVSGFFVDEPSSDEARALYP